MSNKISTIKITSKKLMKTERKISRELELEANDGKWISKHSIHKSKKDYNRHSKHREFDD